MFSQKMLEQLSGSSKLEESYKSLEMYPNLSKFSIWQIVIYFIIDAVTAGSNSKLDLKSLRESSFASS